MRERPILFSAPMVRAILDGRKTQTRRVVKPQPEPIPHDVWQSRRYDNGWWWSCAAAKTMVAMFDMPSFCPYGTPLDYLWLRETWFDNGSSWDGCADKTPSRCVYRANGEFVEQFPEDHLEARWTPSIHMPRWASRITLEITGVRVERLNAISEADAIAEGCQCAGVPASLTNVGAFAKLWESINGPGSWDANPWVWVVEFRRIVPA